jgi:hypothetical protein
MVMGMGTRNVDDTFFEHGRLAFGLGSVGRGGGSGEGG